VAESRTRIYAEAIPRVSRRSCVSSRFFSPTANDFVRASLSHGYTCGINDGIFTAGIRRARTTEFLRAAGKSVDSYDARVLPGSPELFRYAGGIFVPSYVCSVFNRDRNRPDALPSRYTGCPRRDLFRKLPGGYKLEHRERFSSDCWTAFFERYRLSEINDCPPAKERDNFWVLRSLRIIYAYWCGGDGGGSSALERSSWSLVKNPQRAFHRPLPEQKKERK